MRIKDKICKQCGVKFKPFNSLTPVCSPKCALEYNSKKEVDKRVMDMKKETQSLNDLRAIARSVFQTWVRMRDKDLPCISCGKTVTQQWDGGHYLKAEIYTGLIFDEMNCNKQCCNCNDHLQGNVLEYRKGMIKKYGAEEVARLESKADLSRMYKFSRLELTTIAQKYRNEIKPGKSNCGKPIAEQINK